MCGEENHGLPCLSPGLPWSLPFPEVCPQGALPFAYRAVLATYPAIASGGPARKGKKASNIRMCRAGPCHRAYAGKGGRKRTRLTM